MESFYVFALCCVGESRGETCRRDCQCFLFWKLDSAKHKVLPLQFPAQYEHTMALSQYNFGISAHGWTRISSSLLFSWWFAFFSNHFSFNPSQSQSGFPYFCFRDRIRARLARKRMYRAICTFHSQRRLHAPLSKSSVLSRCGCMSLHWI